MIHMILKRAPARTPAPAIENELPDVIEVLEKEDSPLEKQEESHDPLQN